MTTQLSSSQGTRISTDGWDAVREAARFELVFGRTATPAELERFRRCRAGLWMRLPGTSKRAVARIIRW